MTTHQAKLYFAWTFWTRSSSPRFEKVMVSKRQIYQHYSVISAICSRESARIEDRVQCKVTPLLFNYRFNNIKVYYIFTCCKLCSMEKKSCSFLKFWSRETAEFIITSKTCRYGPYQFQMRGQQGHVHAVVYVQYVRSGGVCPKLTPLQW